MPEFAFLSPAWGRRGPLRACTTTRRGGVGTGVQATLSLDARTDVEAGILATNRRRLSSALALPAEPVWLRQVHGATAVDAATVGNGDRPEADAAWTTVPGVVCAALTADCLPVVLGGRGGEGVAVIHAGWRGLAAGVIESTVAALAIDPARLQAWLGPAIGPRAFEVGPEVRAAFVDRDPAAAVAFHEGRGDRWWADLYRLARRRLESLEVTHVSGGGRCTVTESRHFFSHRRDGADCGRMATLAWLSSEET